MFANINIFEFELIFLNVMSKKDIFKYLPNIKNTLMLILMFITTQTPITALEAILKYH